MAYQENPISLEEAHADYMKARRAYMAIRTMLFDSQLTKHQTLEHSDDGAKESVEHALLIAYDWMHDAAACLETATVKERPLSAKVVRNAWDGDAPKAVWH